MKLFVAPNIKEKESKHNAVIYPFITKKGIPVAFEEHSIFWDTLGEKGKNAIIIEANKDYIICPKGSFNYNKKENKMSFKINSVEGTAQELRVDLSMPIQHEREDTVVPVIKKAIIDVVEALGGYLSVSCNGNINPVSGETGDVVQIYITSLPAPTVETAPIDFQVQTPITEEAGNSQIVIPPENQESVQQEIPPVGEGPPPGEPVTVAEVEATIDSGEAPTVVEPPAETLPIIQENPTNTETPVASENPAEIAPEVSSEANTTSIGQAEAQEIAQATPPVEPAV